MSVTLDHLESDLKLWINYAKTTSRTNPIHFIGLGESAFEECNKPDEVLGIAVTRLPSPFPVNKAAYFTVQTEGFGDFTFETAKIINQRFL